jgi:peptidoglycan/LPS O-acetylase OafA/YrhL
MVDAQGTEIAPVARAAQRLSRPEILPLTGIRGVAAASVLLGHVSFQLLGIVPGIPSFVLRALSTQGPLGVDLFFLLSGMIISYNYADRFDRVSATAWLQFLWLRFARLYPVHFVLLLLYLGVVGASTLLRLQMDSPDKYTSGFFLANLLMVHGWTLPTRASWNGVAWSISCEWLAYLAFPLLCLTPVYRLRTLPCTLALVAVLLGMSWLCQCLPWDNPINFGIPRIVAEFVAGACLFNLYSRRAYAGWNWSWIMPLAVVGLAAGVVGTMRLGVWGFWVTPLMAVILLGAAYGRGAAPQFLSTRVMLFLGRVSYSIYMVHMFCLHAVNKCCHVRPGSWPGLKLALLVFGYVGCTLLVATVCYYTVEVPSRHFLRRIWPASPRRSCAYPSRQ